MPARRLIFLLSMGLSVGLVAPTSVVDAQPKAPAKKAPARKAPARKAPVAPAKDPAPAADPGGTADTAGSGADATAGAAVQMAEDPPPKDMSGVEENPDAPRTIADPEAPVITVVAPVVRAPGYPIEEVLRPITLPQTMSEIAITPHAVVSPYVGTAALRARYGITSQVQLGLTYVLGGIFPDPAMTGAGQAFHPGKAVGLDVTVMLQRWIGVSLGVPLYIDPLAVSIAVGAPIKFTFADKLAIGGLDDLLNIKVSRFAPTFYQEVENARNANDNLSNTIASRGQLRVSLFGAYQYEPRLAIIARFGVQLEDFASGKANACARECTTTFLRAGFNYTPRKYLDLGLSIGFDDLAHGGTFAPAGLLAFRI